MNYAGLQWKKSLQCRSAKALSPIGTPSGGIRNNNGQSLCSSRYVSYKTVEW